MEDLPERDPPYQACHRSVQCWRDIDYLDAGRPFQVRELYEAIQNASTHGDAGECLAEMRKWAAKS